MAQIINTNILSLTAQRNLNKNQSAMATAMQRLSSGLRINSAKDDAAGLAISERFTTQIRGLNQAIRNANDGVSFAQTAEGALSTVGDSLQRIRELAVQSVNDTNSSSDRQALNNEVSQLVSEINRVSSSTQFNGQNILDGSLSNLTFQVGANQNQTISVTGVDSRGSALGAAYDTGSAILSSAITGMTDITMNGIAVDLTAATTVSDVVSAINNGYASHGVQALRDTTVTTAALTVAAALTGTATASVTMNGVAIDFNAATSATATTVAAQLNNFSTQTGVTAAVDTAGASGKITLTSSADIAVTADAGSVVGGAETYNRGIILATDVGSTITVGGTDAAALGLGAIAAVDHTLNGVDVLTGTTSNDALLVLDFALQQVSGLRSQLGSVQTRFESTISNLQVTSENMTAARSRIRDTDFAKETADLTRVQILQQAGISMLAQANAQPQNVLALLK
jgi:flagellin